MDGEAEKIGSRYPLRGTKISYMDAVVAGLIKDDAAMTGNPVNNSGISLVHPDFRNKIILIDKMTQEQLRLAVMTIWVAMSNGHGLDFCQAHRDLARGTGARHKDIEQVLNVFKELTK